MNPMPPGGEPDLGREPARVVMRRFALPGNREVGGRLLEGGARVGLERRARDDAQDADQLATGPERRQDETVRHGRRQVQLVAHRVRGLAREMDRLVGVAHDRAHRGARHGTRLEPARRRGGPVVGVIAGLVQGDPGSLRRAGDHAERLRQAAPGLVGRRIERRQELREVLVQPLAPRQRRRHAVDPARDRAELVGLIFGHALGEVPFGDPLERRDHAAERRRQTAPVVPESEPEHGQHRHEQHRRRHRRLHRVVPGVGGELLQLCHACGHGG